MAEKGFDLTAFPNEYCYVASEWDAAEQESVILFGDVPLIPGSRGGPDQAPAFGGR